MILLLFVKLFELDVVLDENSVLFNILNQIEFAGEVKSKKENETRRRGKKSPQISITLLSRSQPDTSCLFRIR